MVISIYDMAANPSDVKNPDDLWMHPGGRSFYYVPKTGHLSIGNAWYERHQDLIKDPSLASQFPTVDDPDSRNTLHLALQGRIGYTDDGQQLVSFWNINQHPKDVSAALKQLQQDGHLHPDSLIVGKGFHEPKIVSDVTGIRQDMSHDHNMDMDQQDSEPWEQEQGTEEMPNPANYDMQEPEEEMPEPNYEMPPEEMPPEEEEEFPPGEEDFPPEDDEQKWWAPTTEAYSFKAWLYHRSRK